MIVNGDFTPKLHLMALTYPIECLWPVHNEMTFNNWDRIQRLLMASSQKMTFNNLIINKWRLMASSQPNENYVLFHISMIVNDQFIL